MADTIKACAWCRKTTGTSIRSDITTDSLVSIASFIDISHGFCPKCAEKWEKESLELLKEMRDE